MNVVNKKAAAINFDFEKKLLSAKHVEEDAVWEHKLKHTEQEAAKFVQHSKQLEKKALELREAESGVQQLLAKVNVYDRHSKSVSEALDVAITQLNADLQEQKNVLFQLQQWQAIPQQVYEETLQQQSGWGYLSNQSKLKLDIEQAEQRSTAIRSQIDSLHKAKGGDADHIRDSLQAAQEQHRELLRVVEEFTKEKKAREEALARQRRDLKHFKVKRQQELWTFEQNKVRFQMKTARNARATESAFERASRLENERLERAAQYANELTKEQPPSKITTTNTASRPKTGRRSDTPGAPQPPAEGSKVPSHRPRRNSAPTLSRQRPSTAAVVSRRTRRASAPAIPAMSTSTREPSDPCNLLPSMNCKYTRASTCQMCGKRRSAPAKVVCLPKPAKVESEERLEESKKAVGTLKIAQLERIKVIACVDHHTARNKVSTSDSLIPLEVDTAICHQLILGKEKELETQRSMLQSKTTRNPTEAMPSSQPTTSQPFTTCEKENTAAPALSCAQETLRERRRSSGTFDRDPLWAARRTAWSSLC